MGREGHFWQIFAPEIWAESANVTCFFFFLITLKELKYKHRHPKIFPSKILDFLIFFFSCTMIPKSCQNECATPSAQNKRMQKHYPLSKNNIEDEIPHHAFASPPHLSQHTHTDDSAVITGKCTYCYILRPARLKFSYCYGSTSAWNFQVTIPCMRHQLSSGWHIYKKGRRIFSWGLLWKFLLVSVLYLFRRGKKMLFILCSFRMFNIILLTLLLRGLSTFLSGEKFGEAHISLTFRI